jgi:hypothetical protein
MVLTREQILQTDLPFETIYIPEWGGDVRIKTMTGQERAAFEDSVVIDRDGKAEVDKKLFFAHLLAFTMVDDEGALLFESTEQVKEQLLTKSGAVLMRIGNRSARLNGLSAQDQEDLIKNSKPVPNGASASASLSH